MKQSWRLSNEQCCEIIALYARGVPIKTISAQFSVSTTYISRLAKMVGLCRYSQRSHSPKSRSISLLKMLSISNSALDRDIP